MTNQTIEQAVEEFNKVFPLPRILALSGGKGVERDKMNNWLTQALTADRLALLTELRESIQTIDFYGWNEQTQSMIKGKVQAHLDELIKSTSIWNTPSQSSYA